jgi:putative transposase
MLSWRHYTFQQRLLAAAQKRGSTVYIVGEEYTSKTCTSCFELHHKLGGSKVFACPHCGVRVDRDVVGSRNIFLKNAQ